MPTHSISSQHMAGPALQGDNLPYLLYVRKSSEADERQTQSLGSQIDVGLELAKKLGVEVITVEDAHTAKEPGRPKFDAMIAMIDSGSVGGLISWHPDRLSRNEIDAATITYRLRKGILKELHFVQYQFMNTNEGILMLQNALSQSQYYSSKLVVDVTRGLNSKRKLGWFPHYPVPGYRNNKHELKGRKTISPDPERFPLIRRMFDYALTGAYTQTQLLEILNDQWGYRTPKSARRGGVPMCSSVMSRLLVNPFYAGVCVESEHRYAGQHTPMLTMAEHERILQLFGRIERVQPKRHEFAYTGTLYCGTCGRLFTAYEVVNRHGSPYTYYKCRVCRGETIGEVSLQAQLLEIASSVSIHGQAFIEWAWEAITRHQTEALPKQAAVVEVQETTMAALDKQLATLRSAYSREVISEEEFVADRQALLSKQQALLQANIRATDRQQQTEATAQNVLAFVENVQKWLNHPDPAVRRSCVRAMGSNPRIVNKNLLLELHPLLRTVVDSERGKDRQIGQFEPSNLRSGSTKKERHTLSNSVWSRTWNLILTQIEEQDLTFPRLTDLVEASRREPRPLTGGHGR